MSSVAVFVFLLDNLAGFNNALNETLRLTNDSHTLSPTLQACEPEITDQILSAVSNSLELNIIPKFTNNNHQVDYELSKEESPEIINAIVDNSLHDEDITEVASSDTHSDVFEDHNTFYRRTNIVNIKNATESKFPKSALFMVAIFETLSNVTAQTCAGTLLSPKWVLTAANCVNILSNLYANGTNQTFPTQYTIVAGSTNPLLDGSAHNVTKVLLYPENSPGKRTIGVDGPYLALMRVDPEIAGPTVELLKESVESGDVMVYGWLLSKNDSGHDWLNRTSMSGLILSSEECHAMYRYKDNDVICLFNNDMDKNITQLSSGGPVLTVHNKTVKMLAVVQTDEHLFVGYPLAGRSSWINQIISNK